ncbi:hypothetical protein [Marivirga sp.]|jgi:hypothetical protein|uniref:hypothetical protein n=1 Tax=Marivirga sp. TaxID=2018662 RepID=UPI003DA76647
MWNKKENENKLKIYSKDIFHDNAPLIAIKSSMDGLMVIYSYADKPNPYRGDLIFQKLLEIANSCNQILITKYENALKSNYMMTSKYLKYQALKSFGMK